MGVYDFVLVEPSVLPNYEGQTEQHHVSWQTRSFRDPMYRLHLITQDGGIYRADQKHDSNGLVESHGETGSFQFLEKLGTERYNGFPREDDSLEWYPIRFVGEIRITSQENSHVYDVDFNRREIGSIEKVDESEIILDENLKVGDKVYDKNDTAYRIVNITNKTADEYVAKEEVKDRGHVIYKERTVADLNDDYPSDDIVVEIEPIHGGRTMPVPASRLDKNVFKALERS